MVAVGTDRRFNKTRDDVVPYTNVGTNTTVTFYDLDLTPSTAIYYFTVIAFSKSFSRATVTSNGFYVGQDGGVTGKLNYDLDLTPDTAIDYFTVIAFSKFFLVSHGDV